MVVMIKKFLLFITIACHSELDFAGNTPIYLGIYHNVSGSLIKPVFNSHNTKLFFVDLVLINQILHNPNDLFLIGMNLTPK